MKYLKLIFAFALFLLLGGVIGVILHKELSEMREPNEMHTYSDALFREQVENVMQLVLIKQDYSGIYPYEYENPWVFGWRNKSLHLSIKATGYFGYNLDNMVIQINDSTHVVTIVLPEPQLVALESSPVFISEKYGWLAFRNMKDYNQALIKTQLDLKKKVERDPSAVVNVQNEAYKIAKILEGYGRGMGYDVKIIGLPPGPA